MKWYSFSVGRFAILMVWILPIVVVVVELLLRVF